MKRASRLGLACNYQFGRKLSPLFFKPTATSQSLACSALPG